MRTKLCAVAFSVTAVGAVAQEGRLVDHEHLQCVIENAYVYQAESDFPIGIIFDNCPDPGGAKSDALLDDAQNSAYPSTRDSADAEKETGEDLLGPRRVRYAFFTREELGCLAQLAPGDLITIDDMALLPDNPCAP